jgi:S-adenosyl-L-methionine hydrolase (adenosine-forming)
MFLSVADGKSLLMTRLITLTTDFGTRDGYVAQMKGVILRIAPDARLVDVTHEVRAFSVLEAAFVLKGIVPYFPQGTIHVGVVDPGVGTDRRGIALRTRDQFWVGPDNGLFSLLISSDSPWEAREIRNADYMPESRHPTFHGRDVFAPVAAHFASGKSFEDVGPTVDDPVCLDIPEPRITEAGIEGVIIYQDRFGNLVSNIEEARLVNPVGSIRVGNVIIGGISRFFGQVPEGEVVALVNSFGFIEIAANRQDASRVLGTGQGTPVRLQWL